MAVNSGFPSCNKHLGQEISWSVLTPRKPILAVQKEARAISCLQTIFCRFRVVSSSAKVSFQYQPQQKILSYSHRAAQLSCNFCGNPFSPLTLKEKQRLRGETCGLCASNIKFNFLLFFLGLISSLPTLFPASPSPTGQNVNPSESYANQQAT